MEQLQEGWTKLMNGPGGRFIELGIALLAVWLMVRLVRGLLVSRVQDNNARYHARKVTTLIGYVLIVLLAVGIFSDRLSSLTVALGVAGAGIAFALQEVIASVAGWLAILFGSFYRTGDRVQLGGIKGDVIDIGVLRTTLMELGEWVDGDLYNGRVVRVANSFVFKEPVFNYSADFPFLWDEITVPIKYGGDWKAARAMLERIAEEVVGEYTAQAHAAWQGITRSYLVEDARVAPMVSLVANDNWIQFTVRYVTDLKLRRRTKDRLYTRILEEIDASKGRFAVASATFQLVEVPALDVRMRSEPAAD